MKLEYGKIKGIEGFVFILRDEQKIEAVYPFMCDKINYGFALSYLREKGIKLSPKKADFSWLGGVLRGSAKLCFEVLNLDSASMFKKKIYKKLFLTKTGSILTYAALSTNAARAVGSAMKNNTFPLLIPCHRVSAKSGKESYSISCYCKKPSACRQKDLSVCSKRIKKMIRDYETA